MKLRRRWLIRAIAFFTSVVMRLWMSTLCFRYRPEGRELVPSRNRPFDRFLYAFWHETLLLPTYFYGRSVCSLISQHADGEFVAEVCRHLRIQIVRGSTTRGGVLALRKLLRAGRTIHLAIPPDGPRGPRRQLQPGIIYLASRTGLSIVPAGFAADRPWRLRSWDRFALPRPWSNVVCVTVGPIHVPPEANKMVLEEYRRRVEDALLGATEAAERLAEGKRPARSEEPTPLEASRRMRRASG
jgi:lysophospholipid acyltransferase (LPLAT)-like uncharacterized protein